MTQLPIFYRCESTCWWKMILSETVYIVTVPTLRRNLSQFIMDGGVGGRGVHVGLVDVGLNVLTCRAGTIIGDNGIQTQEGSNERLFILTWTHSMQLFEEIPLVKQQNDA